MLLFQHFLSRLTAKLAECKQPLVKWFLMKLFLRCYDVNLSEAESSDLHAYESFQSLFIRKLRPEARPVALGETVLVSPADGTISELGDIQGSQLLQVKGRTYDLNELLALNPEEETPFHSGHFITIYLAPQDYHRVHMPCDGMLTQVVYVPGQLFSVNKSSVAKIPRLFARNERLICYFDSPSGPFVLILVAALLVAGIHTQFAGRIVPHSAQHPVVQQYPQLPFSKGAELGYFYYGSTVICLFGKQNAQFLPSLRPGQNLRMGQAIGAIGPGAYVTAYPHHLNVPKSPDLDAGCT